tara:strand:- start:179 stop:655 length:477 start_codon:yes stop_codon:yes gene_type:complete
MLNIDWNTGSHTTKSFEEVVEIAKTYISNGAKIFIGSDSFKTNKKIIFASAICLHGKENPSRYFFIRENVDKNHFNNLASRITEEARRSIEIAEYLLSFEKINTHNIEIHLDVSPMHLNNGTSKFSDMLKGYVTGYGIQCKIKPNAWASQAVADRHSK